MTLPDFVLRTLRARVNANLVDMCIIERYEDSLDAYGNPERSLVSSTEYRCYLIRTDRSAGDMITEADVGRVFYELQLPYDADIADGDTVLIDSERYETMQVYRNQSVDVMRQARLVKQGA